MNKRSFRSKVVETADLLCFPFIYPVALLLRKMCDVGVFRFPNCKRTFPQAGVYPVRNHYYEPQFDYSELRVPLSQERSLPGVDWNLDEQLQMLHRLSYSDELISKETDKTTSLEHYVHKITFGPGDAEFWYQLVRLVKPRRIFEVGSGNSTVMAIKATERNRVEDPSYVCKHVCIEPFEMPWLEQTGVAVIREKIEDLDISLFSELEENDILFIDSSHIVRPQGDVLFEYLQLLPQLQRGVIVHVHDIFSPRNYPREWLEVQVKFWNEQYLLEAFLSHNRDWKIVGALNYLRHHHYDELKSVAPFLTPEREPGSFYMRKVV
jgi:hypothetical protein